MRERFAAGGKGNGRRESKLHSPAGCAPGRTAKAQVPSSAPNRKTELMAPFLFGEKKGIRRDLKGGANVSERFAAGRKENGRRESKLHSPAGCAPGRAERNRSDLFYANEVSVCKTGLTLFASSPFWCPA